MKHRSVLLFLLLPILCLPLVACGSLFKNYGRIAPSNEVNQDFVRFRVHPEYRYYISGSELYPNALMGLHRAHRLSPETLWKEVEMTPKQMKEIIENMQTKGRELMKYPQGFEILDYTGHPIGVWFSILTATSFVRMEEDGTVTINTPDPDTYDRFEPRGESNPQ
jgi:hypothetical protein